MRRGCAGARTFGAVRCSPRPRTIGEIRRTLDEIDAQQISTFDGFTDDEAQRCIARSTIIECAAGDRVLKSGGTARNIFVVLDGTLEVRDGDAIVNVLSAGDAFGEMAFLLERPRAFDVDAATGHTRILTLSEGALRTMIAAGSTSTTITAATPPSEANHS